MKVRAWKQAVALALCFEIVFAPSLANARRFEPIEVPTVADLKNSDQYLRAQETIDEMLRVAHLPVYGPDDRDPWAVQGQYVVVMNREGKVVDRYHLDESTLHRDIPGYSNFRPVLVADPEDPSQKCLAMEATAGEDAHGQHGYVVARVHMPRMCGIASFAVDDEVLTVIDNQGRVSVANYNYISDQLFRGKIFFVRNVYVPPEPIDLKGSSVQSTVLTIGAVPVAPSEITDDTLIALDDKNQPLWESGDVVFRVDGKFKWNFSHRTSRNAILFEMIKIYVLAAYRSGSPEQIDHARALLTEAEKHADDFAQKIAAIDKDSVNPAIAVMVDAMGRKDIDEMKKQIMNFGRYAARQNDRFTTNEWLATWTELQANAEALNASVKRSPIVDKEEDLRVNWQKYLTKDHQTPEQAARALNEGANRAVLKNPWFYGKIAMALAGGLTFLNFPETYEKSARLKDIALMTKMYNLWPNVLKDEAYRRPLKSMALWAVASSWIPDALSIGAKWVFQVMEKATFGRTTKIAQKVRDMARFWIDQERWQRLVTFGYRLGGALMVSPLKRAFEDLGQQKAFLKAARENQAPWRVIRPEDPLGRALDLKQAQTIGITRPSWEGFKRKVKRSMPFVSDPGADIWEHKRQTAKRQLLEISAYERDRKKQYARMLAGLVVAEQEGMPYEVLLERLRDRDVNIEDLLEYIKSSEAAENLELTREAIYQQIKEFSYEFKTDPIMRSIDTEELLKQAEAFRGIAGEIKALKGFDKFKEELRLESKRKALYVWDKALNQGRDEAAILNSRVSGEEVYRNTSEFFPPDNLMVLLLPAFVNIPMLHTRADLNDPSQLAAEAGAWFSMRPVHKMDGATNMNFHFFLGTAMDGLQFEADQRRESAIFTPREQVAAKVLIKNKEGHEELILPRMEKGREGYYDNLFEPQAFWPALKEYGAMVKSNMLKGALGDQALNYLKSSFSTIWIFMALQVASRMVLGHQGWSPTLISSVFLFAGSPIFYKWWGWIIQPANNEYHSTKKLRQQAFLIGRGWLVQAEKMAPDAVGRAEMQRLAVQTLYAVYQQTGRNEPAYALDAEEKTLEQKVAFWLKLVKTEPPKGLLANDNLTKFTSQIRAVGSTITAIPMLVMGTKPIYQTAAVALKWVLYSAGVQFFFINFLGSKSPARDFIKRKYGDLKASVIGCDRALSQ